MKRFLILLCFLMTTAFAYESEGIVKYKYMLTVAKVESSTKSILSKYLIQYPGVKVYHSPIPPVEFNKVIKTISTLPRVCRAGTFEYNLYINKNLFEGPWIEGSIKTSLKAKGYKLIKENEYGVMMWENKNKEYIVNFLTKVTPFTYVNSICKV